MKLMFLNKSRYGIGYPWDRGIFNENKMHKSTLASKETILQWLKEGIFTLHEGGRIYKGTRCLTQRINKRNRMKNGDPRVDLSHESKRRSCHVSHLVWMINVGIVIPKDFEIHHRDEDPLNNNFENLICIHALDHVKLHNMCLLESEDEIPSLLKEYSIS